MLHLTLLQNNDYISLGYTLYPCFLSIFYIVVCISLIVMLGFHGSSAGEESACNAGDPGQKDPLMKG